MKRYDEDYYARWYHGRGAVVNDPEIARRARLALAMAEFVLEREVRSVLDVGCGEGRWRSTLRRVRPRLSWQGVDGSEFVVRRFGRRRNIRLGTFATVGTLKLRGRFDLIVCSDVIHYLPTPELRRGLASLRRLSAGVLWLDARALGDDFEGDHEGWQPRSERSYRRIFGEAGLMPLGLNGWAPRRVARTLSAMERIG